MSDDTNEPTPLPYEGQEEQDDFDEIEDDDFDDYPDAEENMTKDTVYRTEQS